MKFSINYSWKWLAMLLVLPVFLLTTGCDDDDTVIIIPVEDGVYIIGSASNFTDPDNDGKFYIGRNEADGNELRNELGEMFIPLKAGATFTVRSVLGDVTTDYGKGNDWAVVPSGTNEHPEQDFQRGSIAVGGAAFTVPSDGLYHIAYDSEVNIMVIIPVGDWGIIGGATPLGWGGSTAFTGSAFDFDMMTWTGTQIAMTSGDFKFRYSNGWKVELDPLYDNGNGNIGLKVNTNYGGGLSAPVPGGSNITMAGESMTAGYYTFTVTWTPDGYAFSATRTGDLPGTDFSAIEMGLVGDGFDDDMSNQWNWDNTYGLHTPVSMSGADFTYEWTNIEMNSAGNFKIRNGSNWDGPYILGFSSITFGGANSADFVEAVSDDNIHCDTDLFYDFSLTVNGNSLEWTATVTEH